MSEHHRGSWGGREDGMWWPGAVAADQQQTMQQHHQHMMHQQQLNQQQPHQQPPHQQPHQQQPHQQPPHQQPPHQQQPHQQQAHQQQPPQQQQQQHQISSTAAPAQQDQIFSYKMASSFQNPATTISNVSSTSPVGAAGIRGYDYRLGGGMTGGNPTMNAPAPAAQWWYPSAMDNSMQNSMQQQQQNNGQQNNMQSNMQNMQPVHTPPPVSQAQQQANFAEAQRHHQQQQEAQRHHQAAEAHHRQQVEQAHELHRQAVEAHRQQQQVNHQNQLHNQQTQTNHQQNHHQITVQPPVPHKGRMPRGKADARPRGRMTAYACFVQTCREEHKKKHPEESVVFAEFSKKCAERWKTMVDKEKKRFHEMAETDKKRYDAEMQNYVPPKGEKQRGKKRKQIKDPNAPKRSLSAFFWFCHDERAKVKGANPEYGVGDIAKELGKRWSDADSEVKSKYEAIADKDKARYEKEMTAYKKKNNPLMQAAPVPEPEEEEEEEEEVEEDEDD